MIEAEEKRLEEAIKAARVVQTLLWGEANGAWGLEEWRRMFRKRIKRIDDIDPSNPHAIVELKKRLLQNAALSIALLGILDTVGCPNGGADIPSNLPEYADDKKQRKDKNDWAQPRRPGGKGRYRS